MLFFLKGNTFQLSNSWSALKHQGKQSVWTLNQFNQFTQKKNTAAIEPKTHNLSFPKGIKEANLWLDPSAEAWKQVKKSRTRNRSNFTKESKRKKLRFLMKYKFKQENSWEIKEMRIFIKIFIQNSGKFLRLERTLGLILEWEREEKKLKKTSKNVEGKWIKQYSKLMKKIRMRK